MPKIKLCECGCGKPTKIITHKSTRLKRVKGEYSRFIQGHHLKILKKSKKHKERIGFGNFKGGRVSRNGYVYIYVKNHPYAVKYGATRYVKEHRLVMEKHIGRYLKPTEVVHHIDGNKENNNLSNLALFLNQSAHAKFHYILNNINGINKLKGGINKQNGKKDSIIKNRPS